jgi:hypothetical protein
MSETPDIVSRAKYFIAMESGGANSREIISELVAEITRLREALAEADDLLHDRLEAWDATCEALFPSPPEDP